MAKDIKQFIDFSNILADKARLISLKYFKKKIEIKNKKKNSFDPVTIADIEIQKKLNNLIQKITRVIQLLERKKILKKVILMNGALIQLMGQNLLFKVCHFGAH